MKQLYFSFLFILFLNPLIAQTDAIEQLQAQINDAVFKKPDSAKVYLFKLLEHASQLPDTTIAKAYSKLGITYNQLAVYDSAAFYLKKGIGFTEKHPLIQAQLYSNLAINYRTNAQYDESMAALETAMGIYKKLDNLNGEGLVYGEMASNFSYMLQKEKAIKYLKKAIEIFEKTKDPRIHILQQKLANIYFNNGNYEFAVDLYEQVLPKFAENKGAAYYFTLLAYGESLVKLDKIAEGEKRLLEAKNGLTQINNMEYMHVAMGKLGKIYKVTHRPELAAKAFSESFNFLLQMQSTRFLEIAIEYLDFLNLQGDYNKGLAIIDKVQVATDDFQRTMNAGDEINFLIGARETYRNKQNYKKALALFDRIDFLQDSLRSSEDRIKIKELEETYQNQIQREKNIVLAQNNTLLKDNNRRQGYITVLIIILAVVLLFLGALIYKYQRKKIKLQKSEFANLEKSNSALKVTQELEHELMLEKEERLADKERELVNMALEVADIQNKIRDLLDSSNKEEISEPLATKIIGIVDQKNYWKHFKSKFVEVQPEFSYSLSEMFPKLSENDVAFCCLLKLQLTDQEITSLLGISKKAVISEKDKIKVIMGLEDDNEGFEKLMCDL
ncbi:tetratricopeptide repeat protein [Aequorivita capsosiphonis]|uniref:tetratricopeptide repeat protein n=1 Tax=Aequorivita capsosiphonis TaxID=487317 RepID=UPI00047D52F1|nr:tetratricopeptide repeat protein [Aequorivita capsosiphonis]